MLFSITFYLPRKLKEYKKTKNDWERIKDNIKRKMILTDCSKHNSIYNKPTIKIAQIFYYLIQLLKTLSYPTILH